MDGPFVAVVLGWNCPMASNVAEAVTTLEGEVEVDVAEEDLSTLGILATSVVKQDITQGIVVEEAGVVVVVVVDLLHLIAVEGVHHQIADRVPGAGLAPRVMAQNLEVALNMGLGHVPGLDLVTEGLLHHEEISLALLQHEEIVLAQNQLDETDHHLPDETDHHLPDETDHHLPDENDLLHQEETDPGLDPQPQIKIVGKNTGLDMS